MVSGRRESGSVVEGLASRLFCRLNHSFHDLGCDAGQDSRLVQAVLQLVPDGAEHILIEREERIVLIRYVRTRMSGLRSPNTAGRRTLPRWRHLCRLRTSTARRFRRCNH